MSDKLAGVGLCCPSRGVLGGRCGRMGGHRAIGHCCRYTWVAVRPVHAAEGLGLAHAKTWGVESKCPPIWIGGHFTHRAPNGAPKDSLMIVKPQFDENQDSSQFGERK